MEAQRPLKDGLKEGEDVAQKAQEPGKEEDNDRAPAKASEALAVQEVRQEVLGDVEPPKEESKEVQKQAQIEEGQENAKEKKAPEAQTHLEGDQTEALVQQLGLLYGDFLCHPACTLLSRPFLSLGS